MKKFNDLVKIAKNKNLKTWIEIKEYAENFRKYDSLTFRDLDKIWERVNRDEGR